MRKKGFRKIALLLSAVMITQSVEMPVIAMEQEVLAENSAEELLQEEESVSVTTSEAFLTALSQKESYIIINGIITIGDEADSTGKMYPVEIPGGTTIQGTTGSALNCRCPIQLTGDDVTLKDLNITFDSSDALGSVPHREIFLAGYSLTMDNVDTYLEGNGGSLGELGSSEEELLPSVYAGGFENTSIGNNAQLTVVNGNSKTMFKEMYMSHSAGDDKKVAYEGTAIVKISPEIIIREGINTQNNTRAEIIISGSGTVGDLAVYGNENTWLQVEQTNLNRTILDKVGNLVLKNGAYLELQQGELENVTLQENACLDLNKVLECVINGNFTGGTYNLEETDTRGVLVVNEEGSVNIKGAVENTTFFHTDNRSFPGEYVTNKKYILASSLTEGSEGFILPESKAAAYVFSYEEGSWTVCERYDSELVIESIDIVYAPAVVDISKIWGQDYVAAKEAPYCQVYWKDEGENILTASAVEFYSLFYYDYIIPIKTSYWVGEGNLEAKDWKNEYVEFTMSEDNPNCYYFYAGEDTQVEKGEYTFLFLSEPVNGLVTVEDVKGLKEKVKAEMTVYFYDSTKEKPSTPEVPTTTQIPYITEVPSTIPTAGVTITPRITKSPGAIPTASVTVAPNITEVPNTIPTASVTVAPSITKSPSTIPTASVTVAPGITKSPSTIPTASVTVTPGITKSPSTIPTASVTVTPSITKSPSTIPTASVTVTPSITKSPSTIPTASVTVIPSITKLPSTIPTASVTVAPGTTVPPSTTTIPNATIIPSTTIVPSITTTPSITKEPSITAIPNATVPPSMTFIPNVTVTPSTTVCPSTTLIPNATITPSITVAPSPTISPGITVPSKIPMPSSTITPEHKHTWNLGQITKKPSVLQKGEKTYTCTICGEKKTETIPTLKPPKKGTVLTDKKSKAKYKVTKSGKKSGTVEYVKPLKSNVKTVTIPDKVTIDGIQYKVASISSKACYNYKKLKYVTIGKNVKKIGGKAFYGCKSLKKITIKTTKLTQKSIGKNTFTKVNKKVIVKVPSKKFKTYQKILKTKGINKNAKFKK